jgi:CRP-like cAMP-binding protein
VFLLQTAKSGITACVKVTSVARNGTETLLAIRASGDLVGECAALRDDGTRAATVTACAETVAHVIDNKRFAAYLEEHPDNWRPLAERLVNQLDWANRRQLDFAGYDARVRLVRVILELAELYGERTPLGVDLGIQISQEEWGRLVGAKLDTVGPAMRYLKAAGLVSVKYRGLRLTDVAALRDLADED